MYKVKSSNIHYACVEKLKSPFPFSFMKYYRKERSKYRTHY